MPQGVIMTHHFTSMLDPSPCLDRSLAIASIALYVQECPEKSFTNGVCFDDPTREVDKELLSFHPSFLRFSSSFIQKELLANQHIGFWEGVISPD